MKRAHWFILALTLGLLAFLLVVPTEGLAQPVGNSATSAAAQSPVLGTRIDICVDGLDNTEPVVAYNNLQDEYLVVWTTEQSGGGTLDIWAQRVSGDGGLEAGFNVATGPGEERGAPDVAYSPTQDQYLIVYEYASPTNGWDIHGTRVSWNGGWMSSEFPVLSDAGDQRDPAVAYNSAHDEYLVVYWNEWGDGLCDIAAQRVAGDGTMLSWCNIATGTGEDRCSPDVAYNATRNEYLIVYSYGDGISNDGRGKVASHDLGALGGETVIGGGSEFYSSPDVAAGRDEYLVVWQNGSDWPMENLNVWARRVHGDGTTHAIGFEVAGSGQRRNPALAYGAGYGYLVAWRDSEGGANQDVYGRYVMSGQDSAAGQGYVVDDTADWQIRPAVACAPSGDCLVVYQDNWAPGGAGDLEIRGRFVIPHHIYLPLVLRNYP